LRVQKKTVTVQPKADKEGTAKTTVKSTDVWSRVLSLIALIMSLFTFVLQFVAHDAVSYNIAQGTLATWHTGNAYFAVSLNVFNRGNRSAALVTATARLIRRKLSSNQQNVTDA